MHRQALLVSLSLSPASSSAKNDKHWAFLDEIDAPQWADLKAEEALAKAGTIGDDPWFYRSHSHHEVPLTEIAVGLAADVKDSNSSIRTPNLDRKKNRGSSKAKLAFGGSVTVAKSKQTTEGDASLTARHNDSFGADSPLMASPVHRKSPEGFLSSRRFISCDDSVAGNGGPGVLRSFNFEANVFAKPFANDQMNTIADLRAPCASSSAKQSAEDEDEPSQTSSAWQDEFLSKLKDTSRLRKSLGSALRVRIVDDPNERTQRAATRPKSRLRQSVQLEAALPVLSACGRDLRKETAYLWNENELSIQNFQSCRVSSGDTNTGTALANKLVVNSSVQAFDDIRKMRKSWGSALRVKRSEDSPIEDLSSDRNNLAFSDENGVCNSLNPNGAVVDIPSLLVAKIGSEEKLPDADLPAVVRAFNLRARSFGDKIEALDSDKELEACPARIVAAMSSTSKLYRRSVSFDHTPGRGTGSRASTSNSSTNVQRREESRASSVSRVHGPAERLEKGSRLSKGGKENTSLHPLSKTTKLNPGSPKKSRQTVTRISMPSLTFAAHARAAMGGNGVAILKPSGNGVVDTNLADSRRAGASAAKRSAGGFDTRIPKKTDAIVTDAPSQLTSRQSVLRSSLPALSSAAAALQGRKSACDTGAAIIKPGGKSCRKVGNGEADLAALLAEHNRKFRPRPTYEPRIHRVKDIREWEARTGQLFYNLLPAEREKANQEISIAKQTQILKPK